MIIFTSLDAIFCLFHYILVTDNIFKYQIPSKWLFILVPQFLDERHALFPNLWSSVNQTSCQIVFFSLLESFFLFGQIVGIVSERNHKSWRHQHINFCATTKRFCFRSGAIQLFLSIYHNKDCYWDFKNNAIEKGADCDFGLKKIYNFYCFLFCKGRACTVLKTTYLNIF